MSTQISLKRKALRVVLWPLYLLTQAIVKMMCLIPGFGAQCRENIRYRSFTRSVSSCDEKERRHRRDSALKETPVSESFSLWAEEAEDRLYRQEDPVGAFEAFENALRTDIDGSFSYGVWRVHGGAAQAALMAGNREAAQRYLEKLIENVSFLTRNKNGCKGKQRDYLERELDCCNKVLGWVRSELGVEESDGSDVSD